MSKFRAFDNQLRCLKQAEDNAREAGKRFEEARLGRYNRFATRASQNFVEWSKNLRRVDYCRTLV